MNFHFDAYPFPSRRMVTFAAGGMVATSQALASQAGLRVLDQGGNAVDAAIAAAACLTVTEPTSNGIGGDAFALVWHQDGLKGLNASGPAPRALDREKIAGETISPYGWESVTVPGLPAAWAELSRQMGKLSLAQCLEPAAQYAEEGYPLSPIVADNWKKILRNHLLHCTKSHYGEFFRIFAPDDRPPQAGELWSCQNMADTLRELGQTKGESFYRGALQEKIIAFSQKTGGFLQKEDLESYRPRWVEPIHTAYRGYDVWEIPPNGHGLAVLLALNILKGYDLRERSSEETAHLQIEAMKLAFQDCFQYIGDPDFTEIPLDDLLSEEHAEKQRRRLQGKAGLPPPASPLAGGTVYLATADSAGNMVSYIQSNYIGFGSGLVVPETGIALHNRGCCFNLNPGHPNYLEPGKRPYHTIIPGFLTQNDLPIGPFGVMGAMMQPQGQLQVLSHMLDKDLNPQAALDAPRWQYVSGRKVSIEETFPETLAKKLHARGHQIEKSDQTASFGRGQILWRLPNGVYAGGTEPRADSALASR